MKAVVLVGGEGTRLRPLTYSTPKQLLPVAQVPMLERVLAQLASHGIDEAVLSLGYRPDAFLAAYPEGVAAGVRLQYAVEPEPLDTAGAIRFAARACGVDQTFVVVNGDVLADTDVSSLVDFHRRRSAAATIALTAVDDPFHFGVVPTDGDGRVLAFVEKPPPGEAPTDRINAGTYVLEPEVLDSINVGRRVSIERETFPLLVEAGTLFAMDCPGYWLDTGTPLAFLRANADAVRGVRGPVPAPGATEIEAGVWVLGSATIDGEVRAASLIGDAVSIGSGATVVDSVIGAGAQIERGAVVEGSVLFAGARVGVGSSVRGSIMGHRSVVGPEALVEELSVIGDDVFVTAGARLRDARVGAQGAATVAEEGGRPCAPW